MRGVCLGVLVRSRRGRGIRCLLWLRGGGYGMDEECGEEIVREGERL